MSLQSAFKPGDVLIVQPQDPDDLEANALVGKRCQFLRYVAGGIGLYAVVEVVHGKPVYLRPGDLVYPSRKQKKAS